MYDSSTREPTRGPYTKQGKGYSRSLKMAKEAKRIHVKEVDGIVVLVADKHDIAAASPWLINVMTYSGFRLDRVQKLLVEKYKANDVRFL